MSDERPLSDRWATDYITKGEPWYKSHDGYESPRPDVIDKKGLSDAIRTLERELAEATERYERAELAEKKLRGLGSEYAFEIITLRDRLEAVEPVVKVEQAISKHAHHFEIECSCGDVFHDAASFLSHVEMIHDFDNTPPEAE